MDESLINNTSSISIIPQPNKIAFYSGGFSLGAKIDVYFNDNSLQPLANYALREIFKDQQCSIHFQCEASEKKGLYLLLGMDSNCDESYQLDVETETITIKAAGIAGIFYGLQTLMQLYFQAKPIIPCVQIADAPHFNYRGMHLDVSRHFMPLEFIKRYIDLLAFHKMNVFHWHLTDDQGWRIEIKRYPLLTDIGAWRNETVVGHTSNVNPKSDHTHHGGFYTQQQIKELVAYAAQRQITVIPEIDVPGHAATLLAAYPELACNLREFSVQGRFGIFTDVLCNKETTFTFIENILAEVTELFPSEHIHIGGDEVKKTAWQNCDNCNDIMKSIGSTDYNALHSYFVKRVESIAKAMGKKIIGWDELLDGDVDSSATIMSWRGIDGGKQAAIKGHQVVMTPVDALYFDFYQSTSLDEPMAIHGLTPLKKVYDYNPVPDGLSDIEQSRILGAQGNVWTEYMPTSAVVERMILPRMTALAEVLWTTPAKKDWMSFQRRLPTFIAQLTAKNYLVSNSYKNVTAAAQIHENDIAVTLTTDDSRLDIVYTLDNSQPTTQSLIYQQPIVCNQRTTIKAAGLDKENNTLYGCETLTLVPHKAMAKPIKLKGNEDASVLVNGQIGTDRIFQHHEWLEIGEQGMEALVDLESAIDISSVELGYQAGQYRELYLPSSITIEVSTNRDTWKTVSEIGNTMIKASVPRIIINFDTESAQYVRVTLENSNRDYSEEDRAIIAMPVYLDEIIVN